MATSVTPQRRIVFLVKVTGFISDLNYSRDELGGWGKDNSYFVIYSYLK